MYFYFSKNEHFFLRIINQSKSSENRRRNNGMGKILTRLPIYLAPVRNSADSRGHWWAVDDINEV